MNYTEVYTNTFANITYSNDDHVQYNTVLDRLANVYNTDSYFSLIDVGSGRGQLIKRIKENYPNVQITSVDLNKFHDEDVLEFIKCDLSVESDRHKLLEKSYNVVT
jgi:cyclopropane fatty-acyl-phospholipid synthase-like methyltransferase